MMNGYRPSVARVYSEEDARQHFYHFYKDKCVLIFMSEGPKGIVKQRMKGLRQRLKNSRMESSKK